MIIIKYYSIFEERVKRYKEENAIL